MWQLNKEDKIVVVYGGPSSEREVSLRTGTAIAEALTRAGYRVEKIDFEPVRFMEDMQKIQPQVVFNALHGHFGEDGAIQHMLEMLGIPYTGSGPIASAITMDKVIAKRLFAQATLPTSDFAVYMCEQPLAEIQADIQMKFSFPLVVKAPNQGSTIGIHIIHKETELEDALRDVFSYDRWALVEKFLEGDEFTVSVLNGEALPVIQIVPHSGVYDYASKYTVGATDYLVPAPIRTELQERMQELSVRAYRAMGCNGVARVDFMTDSAGEPYILEINTVPGMTETSLVPKAAAAVGKDFTALCENILSTADCGKL